MSDIKKLQEWFENYLITEKPQNIGGGAVEISSNNEDVSGLLFIKGRADISVSENLCIALGVNGHDLNRYALAFKKINELTKPFTYSNAYRLRMSTPFQNCVMTLLELEDYAKRVIENDDEVGPYTPTTNLIEYTGATKRI
jgi:hypothetical protein